MFTEHNYFFPVIFVHMWNICHMPCKSYIRIYWNFCLDRLSDISWTCHIFFKKQFKPVQLFFNYGATENSCGKFQILCWTAVDEWTVDFWIVNFSFFLIVFWNFYNLFKNSHSEMKGGK